MKTPLYHVTPRRNLDEISRIGLKVECHIGRKAVIWLCEACRLPWAVQHLSKRHGIPAEFFSILSVDPKILNVTQFRDGLWVTKADVPPSGLTVACHYALGEPQ